MVTITIADYLNGIDLQKTYEFAIQRLTNMKRVKDGTHFHVKNISFLLDENSEEGAINVEMELMQATPVTIIDEETGKESKQFSRTIQAYITFKELEQFRVS